MFTPLSIPSPDYDWQVFELGQWLREANLTMQHMTGLTYNPITRHYRLNERDVDVNYMVHVKKPD